MNDYEMFLSSKYNAHAPFDLYKDTLYYSIKLNFFK